MIGATGNELSAAVHWWYWNEFFPFLITYSMSCILHNTPQIVTSIFISFSGHAIAFVSLFLCQHWLDKKPQITNPINILLKYSTMLERTSTPGTVVPSPTGNKMSLHN